MQTNNSKTARIIIRNELLEMLTDKVVPSAVVHKHLKEWKVPRSMFLSLRDELNIKSMKEPGYQSPWMMTIEAIPQVPHDWPKEHERLKKLHGKWRYRTDAPGLNSPEDKNYEPNDILSAENVAAIQGVVVNTVFLWCMKEEGKDPYMKGEIAQSPCRTYRIKCSDAVRNMPNHRPVPVSRAERDPIESRTTARYRCLQWFERNATEPNRVTGEAIRKAIIRMNVSRRTMEQAKSDLQMIRQKIKGHQTYMIPKEKQP